MEKTQKNVQLIVHVGEGLDNVARFVSIGSDFDGAHSRLARYVAAADERLAQGKTVTTLVAPEAMRNLGPTLWEVMTTLKRTKREGGILSVVTFSKDLLAAMLSCVYELDISAHVVVMRHSTRGAVTMHTLDEEACLENDWPYGALDVYMDHHTLAGLGFPEAQKVYERRQAEKQETNTTHAY